MSLARTWSVALSGLDGLVVEVEADLAQGLPHLVIVGLPDTSVSEARDRVRAALVNSGHAWPARRITVGLSPASVRKVGAGFDLSIAVAVLAAAEVVPRATAAAWAYLGELGLDGRVRSVPGVLPAVMAATRGGLTCLVVPQDNLAEAQLVPGAQVCGVGTLRELVQLLRGELDPGELQQPTGTGPAAPADDGLDLDQVVGQEVARHALEVAAAGGHHLFMIGPPGCGKTMLAERLPSILPDLDRQTALEVTAVHSVAGALPQDSPLITRPPLRAPHHSATLASLVGGGSNILRPGAISQAHRGVLFLDEAPEFSPHALDALRQPMESGIVEIARARVAARFPARFQLVMAANPCPCGRSAGGRTPCECSSVARLRYLGRLSGPLLDRMDIRIRMEAVHRAELLEPRFRREGSAEVGSRVLAARERQAQRLRGTPWRLNSEVPGSVLRERWPMDSTPLRAAVSSAAGETGRGLDKILRLAWTVADLRGAPRPEPDDVAMAGLLRAAS